MTKTTERIIRLPGCHCCPYAYAEPPKALRICAHPSMTRRFDVTTFVSRKEFPARCPLEVMK